MAFLENLQYGAAQGLRGLGGLTNLAAKAAPLAGAVGGGLAGGAAGGIGAVPGAGLGSQIGSMAASPLSGIAGGFHGLANWLNPQNQQVAQAGQMAQGGQLGQMAQGNQQQMQRPISPEQQAQQQLLQQMSQFNQQPYIQNYLQNVLPQITEQFGGRGSSLGQGLQRGSQGLVSTLQQADMQRQNMLGNYLAGQQGLGLQRGQMMLGGLQNRGSYLNNLGQLNMQRAGAPVQAGLQASQIGLGQMQSPYMQQGQGGWFSPFVQGVGQTARTVAPFFT